MAEIKLNKQHPLYQEGFSRIVDVSGVERLGNRSFIFTWAMGLMGGCMIDALLHYSKVVGASLQILPLPENVYADVIIPLASNTHPLAYSQYPIETIEINVKDAEHALVFGPTMLMSDTKASSQFILKALAGEDIILKGKGEQFFSYTYVAYVVRSMLYILFSFKSIVHRTLSMISNS